MVIYKSHREIELMGEAGKITAGALELGRSLVKPGITTKEIDSAIHKYILSQGAVPSFLGYGGYPASACISINEELIHGIPGNRVIAEGDIVSIDVGAFYKGFHGDSAATFGAGKISDAAKKLLEITQECLKKAIDAAIIGNRLGDIGNAVETLARKNGYGIVTKFVGHGIGSNMHEDPSVPNFGREGRGLRLEKGMTIAIEPMITAGDGDVVILEDGWTVITTDKSLAAHFEHTVAITENGPLVLTRL